MKKIFSLVAAVLFAGSMMAEAITCEQAAEAARNGSTDAVTVRGYVTSIATAWNSSYKNISFWMADTQDGGQVFEAYRAACETAEDAPAVGDLVEASGNLALYNSTAELAAGCTFVIVEKSQPAQNLGPKTIAEFLELKNSKDTCILTGVIANLPEDRTANAWKYGNFDLIDATGSVYVYGLLTPDGQAQKFAEMGLENGDTITIKSLYAEYQGNPQAANSILVDASGDLPPVEQADVTFLGSDFAGQGTASTGSPVSATKDGVTFVCDKAYSDDEHSTLRCYKNGVITITSETEQIGKLVFQFYSTYTGDLQNEVVVNTKEWSYTLTNQARIEKLEIYFGEYEPIDPPVVVLDTLTVAEAVEIGMALEDGAKTEKDYVVAGYVVAAYEPNEGYTDQTWFMADERGAYGEFEAYRCTPDSLVVVDDFVYVKGKIQKYVKDEKVQIEIGNGTATHGEAPQGIENVQLTNEAQKVMVDGVMYIVRDGKMFNVQGAQVR